VRRWIPYTLLATLAAAVLAVAALSATSPANQVQSFQLRAVFCFAPRYSPKVSPTSFSAVRLPACSPASLLTPANLRVRPARGLPGYRVATVPWDARLAAYPSTPQSRASSARTVLLDASSSSVGPPGPRFLLGPVLLTGSSIASARVAEVGIFNGVAAWVLKVTLTHGGSRRWDAASKVAFHTYVAVVVNGQVAEAALVEPQQASWASFKGQLTVSSGWTAAEVRSLAAVLDPHAARDAQLAQARQDALGARVAHLGRKYLRIFQADFRDLQRSIASRASWAELDAVCVRMHVDTARFDRIQPPSNTGLAAAEWMTASSAWDEAASDCSAAVSRRSRRTLTQTRFELA
jgi:hypothetical protein